MQPLIKEISSLLRSSETHYGFQRAFRTEGQTRWFVIQSPHTTHRRGLWVRQPSRLNDKTHNVILSALQCFISALSCVFCFCFGANIYRVKGACWILVDSISTPTFSYLSYPLGCRGKYDCTSSRFPASNPKLTAILHTIHQPDQFVY